MFFPDRLGNVYIVDDGNSRIRKVDASGTITTFAGGGSSTANNIPATNASLSLPGGGAVVSDAYGNILFADGNRIRKVVPATGIITTIAGSTSSGFSGDNGPATSALLNYPHGLCVDVTGNIYISDEGNQRIRKINSSGIIITVAGSGGQGFSGDNGLATSAEFSSPDGMCFDAIGNLYVADRYNYRIRKIDVFGIITTYAGSGSSGFCGDNGPATSACLFEPSYLCMDTYGNLYIGDFHNSRIRKVNTSGIISTFAGGGSSSANNILATSASFSDTWGVGIDQFNNIYVPDRNHYRICKVNGIGGPTATSLLDSFSVAINSSCTSKFISIIPAHYSSSLNVETWFGDGTEHTDTISQYLGYAALNHSYLYPGIYTIKHVLYNGTVALDSISYRDTNVLCNTIPIEFYYDANNNCIKDSGDAPFSNPLLVEIDSNNIPIDTISATSGLYYSAYGNIGDVYEFKIISISSAFHATCPANGVIYDTISNSILNSSQKSIALQCNASSSFDLNIHAIIPVTGVQDEWGNIYVQNSYCQPTSAVLTLHYSPKYAGTPDQINPPATSVSGNTITWNLNSLSSSIGTGALSLHYEIWSGNTHLSTADTVHSYFTISPIAGDADSSNNKEEIIDTVRAGCDPNEMWVSPTDCIVPATTSQQLKYTINFENTGNDTAHNIYVLDTLSDFLIPSSLRIIMTSHPMYLSKTKDTTGRSVLKFDFSNINLLDSSHHGQCDGTIIFTINTKQGVANGIDIGNRAGVYFDVNPVVLTNQVDNIIGCGTTLVNTPEEFFSIYPNPANSFIYVDNRNNISPNYFVIKNSIGQIVLRGKTDQKLSTIGINGLPSGIYIINISNSRSSYTGKFVKI